MGKRKKGYIYDAVSTPEGMIDIYWISPRGKKCSARIDAWLLPDCDSEFDDIIDEYAEDVAESIIGKPIRDYAFCFRCAGLSVDKAESE